MCDRMHVDAWRKKQLKSLEDQIKKLQEMESGSLFEEVKREEQIKKLEREKHILMTHRVSGETMHLVCFCR